MAEKNLDHDLLIRLETKMDSVVVDIKELKDGTTQTMAGHGLRIKKLEDITTAVKPVETVAEFRVLQNQVRDFFTTANTWRVITGLISGAIVFLLTQLPNILKAFGVIR